MDKFHIKNQKSKILREIGEIGLIEKIKKWARIEDPRVIVPLGDDAAVVKTFPKFYTILTTDSFAQDIHFKLDLISPFELAYKALTSALSDIAAMAGVPRFALISLGVKGDTELNFIQLLYKGLKKVAGKYGVSIVGGDTFRSKTLILNVTIIGEVEPKLFKTRSQAKVGDKVLVTGSLGEAAAALEIRAHLFPKPRIAEARIASRLGARAMEDISDGLSTEIFNICQASRVGARVFAKMIPIGNGVKKAAKQLKKSPLELALNGGEDFELVFTAPPVKVKKIKEEILKETNTEVTEIGEIVSSKEGMKVILPDGRPLPLKPLGYNHFRPSK